MTPNDFRFTERLRVRWAEIDAQKIVFNGHYLMYFDTAVAGYWRALAMPYHETMAALEGDLYVRKATLDYRASARYDDQLAIGMRCQRIGTSSIVFQGAAFRQAQFLVGCELVYVFADPATQTSRPVPAALRQVLEGFEAGEAMTSVRVGGWDALGAAAAPLRRQVFVEEQGVPVEVESDGLDTDALHAVAFNRFELPLATGRLLGIEPGVSKIGRMAVAQGVRGVGVGRQVLDALVGAARARGDSEVRLHAQRSAANFYRRAGFEPVGEAFMEAGIDHQEMRLGLAG